MKSDRLLSIIIILTEKKLISAPTLADMLEVSVRTIYRDVDTLSMAGIPIYTTTGKNGGIGILDSYKIDKQLFNNNDITSLLIGLNSINDLLPEKSLNHLTYKINSLLDENHKSEVKRQLGQLKIDHSIKNNIKSIKIFEDLQFAIQKQKVIKIVYKDRKGKNTKRNIEPYRILIKENQWYLQGFCLLKNNFRTFKINRIEHFEISDYSYKPRTLPIEELNEFCFYDDNINAQFRITNKLKERIVSLYGNECIISNSNTDSIIEIPIPLNDWGLNHILSFGEDCQCIGPIELKKALKTKLQNILSHY